MIERTLNLFWILLGAAAAAYAWTLGIVGPSGPESGLFPFISALIILGAGVVSQLLPKIGPRPLQITGLAMAVVGMFLLTRIGVESSYVTHVLPSEILISLGMAATFVPTASTALVGVEPRDAGIASAVLNTAQQVGGSLGLAILTTIYASTYTGWLSDNPEVAATAPDIENVPGAAVTGYHYAFAAAAGILALALIVAIVLIKAKKEDLPAEGAVAA